MVEEQRYRFVYCLYCRYDVEEEEGYMAAKHWDFCPRCGNKLVRMNRDVIDKGEDEFDFPKAWAGEESE